MHRTKTRRLSNRLSKKYYAVKKLNNKITNDKIINDNDNDFYCISIIIKLNKD